MKNIFDDLDIVQNILVILISQRENEKMNNILNFRTINKCCNTNFNFFMHNLPVNFKPMVLFVDFSRCSICNMPICNSNRRILTYNYDKLPHKSIIFCTSSICRLKALKKICIR